MTEDWFVIGIDPLKNQLLVRSRTTKRTGVVSDPTAAEVEKANAQNFEPYPWVEPARVRPHAIKPATMSLSRTSQRLSGVLRKTQSITTRVE